MFAQQSDAADVPKCHAFCKDEEQNARHFGTPLIWALGHKNNRTRQLHESSGRPTALAAARY
jgi:hypothetical protein